VRTKEEPKKKKDGEAAPAKKKDAVADKTAVVGKKKAAGAVGETAAAAGETAGAAGKTAGAVGEPARAPGPKTEQKRLKQDFVAAVQSGKFVVSICTVGTRFAEALVNSVCGPDGVKTWHKAAAQKNEEDSLVAALRTVGTDPSVFVGCSRWRDPEARSRHLGLSLEVQKQLWTVNRRELEVSLAYVTRKMLEAYKNGEEEFSVAAWCLFVSPPATAAEVPIP